MNDIVMSLREKAFDGRSDTLNGKGGLMMLAADEIERLRDERDAWMKAVGAICAAVPLPDVLAATATTGDLIEYLKKNLSTFSTKEPKA